MNLCAIVQILLAVVLREAQTSGTDQSAENFEKSFERLDAPGLQRLCLLER